MATGLGSEKHRLQTVFPSDLSTEQVVEWSSAISGSMQSQGITAIPSIVFELSSLTRRALRIV
jgi:hypothetical protein